MDKRDLEVGDVVQLEPDHKFGGMLLVVTEPKSFGCQGYLMSPFNFDGVVKAGGIAYLRASFDDFEYIGKLVWNLESKE